MYELLTYDHKRSLWMRDGLTYATARVATREIVKLAKLGVQARKALAQPITSRLVLA